MIGARTAKIGWDGWTPTAGEVNAMPETRDSIFGSSIALRMIAPPVECPKQKQGSPGFSVNTFSRNDFKSVTA